MQSAGVTRLAALRTRLDELRQALDSVALVADEFTDKRDAAAVEGEARRAVVALNRTTGGLKKKAGVVVAKGWK